jgi:hypothetical protein
MKTFEISTTVLPAGEIRLAGVPFSAGTEVDVIVSPKRKSAEEFRLAWEEVCRQLRSLPQLQAISDEDIQAEFAAHRFRLPCVTA